MGSKKIIASTAGRAWSKCLVLETATLKWKRHKTAKIPTAAPIAAHAAGAFLHQSNTPPATTSEATTPSKVISQIVIAASPSPNAVRTTPTPWEAALRPPSQRSDSLIGYPCRYSINNKRCRSLAMSECLDRLVRGRLSLARLLHDKQHHHSDR